MSPSLDMERSPLIINASKGSLLLVQENRLKEQFLSLISAHKNEAAGKEMRVHTIMRLCCAVQWGVSNPVMLFYLYDPPN